MRTLLLLTPILLSASAVEPFEDPSADIRLSGGVVGHRVQINPDGRGIETIGYREVERFTLDQLFSLGIKSYGGWIWGFGGSYGDAHGTFRDQDIEWQSWGIRLLVGYALPVTEHISLDLVPYMGVGRNYLDATKSTTLPTLHTNDYYRELGINLTALYLFADGFEAGITVGVLRQDGEDDDAGNYTFRATNAVGLAVIGYRF